MTDLGNCALINLGGVVWQLGISPDLHICIDANEGHDLHLSNEASQTQPGPAEFLAPFWLRQLFQHLGRGREVLVEPSLQIRDGARFLGEFGSAGFTFPPFPG